MSETGTPPEPQGTSVPDFKRYELLAARNATLRLRAESGHVFPFTDLTSGQGAANFGYSNPEIESLLSEAANLTAYSSLTAVSYARWLTGRLGLENQRVLFCSDGAEAAVELAQRARPGTIVTVAGSDHGIAARDQMVSIAAGSGFDGWKGVSCLVYEPIQAANGYVPLALPWLRELSRAAQAAGVVVIADESRCGFFRFGKLSLAESGSLGPDLYVFGNSMSNGMHPCAAIVYPRSLVDATPSERSSGKNRSVAAGMQAAEAVARYIDGTDIEGQVLRIHRLLGETGELLAANRHLSAIHLAGPTMSVGVLEDRAVELVMNCERRGVLVSTSVDGRRVVLAPPTTIPLDQLATALKAVEAAAAEL